MISHSGGQTSSVRGGGAPTSERLAQQVERTCSVDVVSQHRLPAPIVQLLDSKDGLLIRGLVSQISELFIPRMALVIADD